MIVKNKSDKNGPVAIVIGRRINKNEINFKCQEPVKNNFIFYIYYNISEYGIIKI
tara:strand:+ start:103 stop:267 length:165 start_codon:yes stop_codon:yes gene_type:complete